MDLANRAMASARRARAAVPHMMRMGAQPIWMAAGRPHVTSSATNQVVSQVRHAMPGREYDAARAGYRYNQAQNTGTVWQMMQARARLMRLGRRPGWGKGRR
jgi:hypothetical protein